MLDEKLPDEIRGGGNLGVFQPVFQDLCSTGKNKIASVTRKVGSYFPVTD